MHLFSCDVCHQQLYFESSRCTKCHSPLGFLNDLGVLSTLRANHDDPETFSALAEKAGGRRVRYCKNARLGACNWLVDAERPGLCRSCVLSEVIPDVSEDSTRTAWVELEKAKRRLLFTLQALGLPVESRKDRPDGLAFRLLKPTPSQPVLTGHAGGVITINVDEANHAFRENQKALFAEAYRTPLGHFRHESGHYYFDRLVVGSKRHEEFRRLFGDERADYAAHVKRYYAQGPSAFWPVDFISAYATMHPWEDWAETWAHYLHMVDTLDTAQSYAVAIQAPSLAPSKDDQTATVTSQRVAVHTVDASKFEQLIEAWIPLTLALNSLNRSMGQPDAYPFSLSQEVQRKLNFVHDVVRDAASNRLSLGARAAQNQSSPGPTSQPTSSQASGPQPPQAPGSQTQGSQPLQTQGSQPPLPSVSDSQAPLAQTQGSQPPPQQAQISQLSGSPVPGSQIPGSHVLGTPPDSQTQG